MNSSKSNNGFLSLFKRFFSLLSGRDDDPKSTHLKHLIKSLIDVLKKHPKCYRYSSHEVLAPVGKLFYDIYTVVGPPKAILQNLRQSEQFKNILVGQYLTEDLRRFSIEIFEENLFNSLYPSQLAEFRESLSTKAEEINIILSDKSIAQNIDYLYSSVYCLVEFINFDFYQVLKKFDPRLHQNDFHAKMNYTPVPASQLIHHLDDFLSVATPLLQVTNWEEIFEILRNYRSTEIITPYLWKKVIASIEDVVNSRVFESIIKIIRDDPMIVIGSSLLTIDIVNPYLKRLSIQVKKMTNKIDMAQRHKNNSKIGRTLFAGSEYENALLFYTPEGATKVLSLPTDAYEYTDILSAIIQFYDIYLEREIKKIVDRLILVGKWSDPLRYKALTSAIDDIEELYKEIIEFDRSLNGDSPKITYLKSLSKSHGIGKARNDDSVTLRNFVNKTNDIALSMVRQANQYYSIVGVNFKAYIDDLKLKPSSEIILNWDDIIKSFDRPFGRYMAGVYTKLYQLIQMMRQFIV